MTISALQTGQSSTLSATAPLKHKAMDESQMAKEALDKFDSNGDGKLDKVEISAMAEEMSKNGPAISAEQLLAADSNGDGSVSASELAADMKAHKPQGPPPGEMSGNTTKTLLDSLTTTSNDRNTLAAFLQSEDDSGN